MKRPQLINLIMAGAILTIGAAGCKKKPVGVTNIPNNQGPVLDPSATPAGPVSNTSGLAGNALPTELTPIAVDPNASIPLGDDRDAIDSMREDREILRASTLYFEFDKAAVRPDERSKVEMAATYLKNEPSSHLLVEGHCDERGTEEYNRSLGERRALSVREYLANLGVSPARVHTKSLGENKPAVLGHDEFAFSKNRRAEFVVLKPK